MPFDSWESYFWPGTQVLRNKLGEHDPVALQTTEYGLTAWRQRQFERGVVSIPRTYDAAHLKAIHRHLFQDLYEWAGGYRIINMAKGRSEFADLPLIDLYLRDAHQQITTQRWDQLDRADFAHGSATVYAYINQAHPFREGNGRAAKVFMEHVAEQSRFSLEFAYVTSEQWNSASALSGPNLGAYEPVPDSLVPVFERIAVDRPIPPPAAPTSGELAGEHATLQQQPTAQRQPTGYDTPSSPGRYGPQPRREQGYER